MKVKLVQKVNLGVTFISFSLKIHLRLGYQKKKIKKGKNPSLLPRKLKNCSPLFGLVFFNVVSI